MKLRVACALRVSALLVITGLLVPLVPGQTPKRKPPTRTITQPAVRSGNDTLKICQGVPVPKGYVIVAYITTPACPHGAYVLKKQDQYSESVAESYTTKKPSSTASGNTRPPATSSSSVPLTLSGPAAQNSQSDTGTVDPFLDPPAPINNDPGVGTIPQSSTSAAPLRTTTDPGSRPRRVGTSGTSNVVSSTSPNQVAVVTDDEPERPARPPQWAGTAPSKTPVDSSGAAAVDPGPEEVEEGDVVRIDTSFVTVPVSVMDRNGRFIPDLNREDFTVFENGIEQKIAHWEPADKPFTVALLLDTSPSTQFHLWQIKEAAIAFAKQLRPQDRVLIVSFNDQVLLLTEVTNDLNVIHSVIEQNAQMGTATRLYDAVHLVIKERLNKIKGRKAIVLFTDGVDTASYQANYSSTMREVEELDALIYPVQYDTTDYMRAMQGGGNVTVVTTTNNGPFGSSTSRVTYQAPKAVGPNGGPLPGTTQADYDRANQYLHELADKTAGRLYRANDPTELANAFSQIAEELRRQYSLGYYPQGGVEANADRRQIKVRVNRPNVAVRARDSYLKKTSATH